MKQKSILFSILIFLFFSLSSQQKITQAYLNNDYQISFRDTVSSFVDAAKESLSQLPGFPMAFPSDTVGKPFFGMALANVDNQDGEEIVLAHSNYLTIITGKGKKLWTVTLHGTTQYPASIADINQDGILEIVVASSDKQKKQGYIEIFDVNGQSLSGFPYKTDGIISCAPVLKDMNHNKHYEIIFGTKQDTSLQIAAQTHVITSSGKKMPGFPVSMKSDPVMTPSVSDIDQDGFPEIFTATQYALYAFDRQGFLLEGYPIEEPFPTFDYSMQSPLLVNFKDSVNVDMIGGFVGFENSYVYNKNAFMRNDFIGWPKSAESDRSLYQPSVVSLDDEQDYSVFVGGKPDRSQEMLYGFHRDGSLRPGFPILRNDGMGGFICIADINNDQQQEILFDSDQIDENGLGFIHAYTINGELFSNGFPLRTKGFSYMNGAHVGDVVGDQQTYIVALSYDHKKNKSQVYVNVFPIKSAFHSENILFSTYKGNNTRDGQIFINRSKKFQPVENLSATTEGDDLHVTLLWHTNGKISPTSCIIMKDGQKIAELSNEFMYSDKEVTEGEHTYQVIAKYENHYESEPASTSITIEIPVSCDAVTHLEATLIEKDVMLTWEAPSSKPDYYKIYKDHSMIEDSCLENTFHDIKGASDVSTYQVIAVYKTCESEPVETIIQSLVPTEKIVLESCKKVENVSIFQESSKITLQWKAPEDETAVSYKIMKDQNVIKRDIDTVFCVLDDEPIGIHSYSVVAVYDYCESEPVETVFEVMEACPTPMDFKAIQEKGSVVLTWFIPIDNIIQNFTIYRDQVVIKENCSEFTFTDENVEEGEHVYEVLNKCNNDESFKSSVMITVSKN